MSNRQLVIDLVNKLPADTPLEEIIDKIEFIAGIKQGIAEAERSEGVSVKEARCLIKTWTSKKLRHPERSEANDSFTRNAPPERSRRT